jgi:hypothetical protein
MQCIARHTILLSRPVNVPVIAPAPTVGNKGLGFSNTAEKMRRLCVYAINQPDSNNLPDFLLS